MIDDNELIQGRDLDSTFYCWGGGRPSASQDEWLCFPHGNGRLCYFLDQHTYIHTYHIHTNLCNLRGEKTDRLICRMRGFSHIENRPAAAFDDITEASMVAFTATPPVLSQSLPFPNSLPTGTHRPVETNWVTKPFLENYVIDLPAILVIVRIACLPTRSINGSVSLLWLPSFSLEVLTLLRGTRRYSDIPYRSDGLLRWSTEHHGRLRRRHLLHVQRQPRTNLRHLPSRMARRSMGKALVPEPTSVVKPSSPLPSSDTQSQ